MGDAVMTLRAGFRNTRGGLSLPFPSSIVERCAGGNAGRGLEVRDGRVPPRFSIEQFSRS